MPRKWPDSMIYDVIEKYAFERLSVREAASQLDIPDKRVRSILKTEGFQLRNMTYGFAGPLLKSAIIDLYASGIGLKSVAAWLGTPVPLTARVIEEAGHSVRNRSEQQQARMNITPPEEIARLVSKAHQAAKGREVSFEALCKAAKSREESGRIRSSHYEDMLAKMLSERGIATTPQKAIGPYNCDLATRSVAVEVFGGHWHWSGKHFARTEERFRYIMESGYHIVALAVSSQYPITDAVGDYIADLVNVLESDPAAAREYRVVWGPGDFTTGGGLDDDHISIEPPFTNVRDPRTGRYVSVPK